MKKRHIWIMAAVLAFGMHTSALAADYWQEEKIITSLRQMMQIVGDGGTYRSSNESVATVSKDGIIRFHKEGTAVISITQGDTTFHQPYRVIANRDTAFHQMRHDRAESRATASFTAEVVRLVNIERAKYGLAPVAEDVRYQRCADIRAEEITRVFSHTRPDGRQWSSVLTDHNAGARSMAENIAMGYNTPAEVVSGWMTSDGHRANILNGRYNHLAVGCKQGADGDLYWVQLFTMR